MLLQNFWFMNRLRQRILVFFGKKCADCAGLQMLLVLYLIALSLFVM